MAQSVWGPPGKGWVWVSCPIPGSLLPGQETESFHGPLEAAEEERGCGSLWMGLSLCHLP